MDHIIIQKHLTWLGEDKNKNFNKDVFDYPYVEILEEIWGRMLCMKKKDDTFNLEKALESFYIADVKKKEKLDDISKQVQQDVINLRKKYCGEGEKKFAFVTVGYDDRKITPAAMKKMGELISAVSNKNCNFESCVYVHEKFRASGVHHHTHFLFTYTDNISKSRIKQYIWQIVNNKTVQWVGDPAFIDIKGSPDKSTKTRIGSAHRKIEEFQKYIAGDKIDEKLPFCKKDAEWRKENNLE